MVCSMVLFGTVNFGKAQTGTNVNGIISSDTTWTQANSPYTLTGPVAILQGVTLTIDAGVTVNLSTNYLQVNGTLFADGTSVSKINFISTGAFFPTLVYGQINFMNSSTVWNQQTSSGCIIENSVLNTTVLTINNASPKINANIFNSQDALEPPISIQGGSSIISNNIINGANGLNGINTYESTMLDNATISDNLIIGCKTGISLFAFGTSTVEGNLIMNNGDGIQLFTLFNSGSGNPTVENNTVINNLNGISFNIIGESNVNPMILENNIYGNGFNIYSTVSNNINATYNWWGTTDTQAINQTIYDYKNNFNYGNVTFTPFLTVPNSRAPTYINATTSTGGSITPSGIIKANYGDSQTFNITPDSGYVISDVSINGTSIGAVTLYTAQNIQGTTNISVTFTAPPVGPTQVRGIISKNTIWYASGGPYNLLGSVLVNNGVTLTIEAGTTINLNYYNLEINGTLTAVGKNDNRIKMTGQSGQSQLWFDSFSSNWNNQTQSGSILKNAVLDDVRIFIFGVSPLISNNLLFYSDTGSNGIGIVVRDTSSAIICNNTIEVWQFGIYLDSGSPSPLITNNNILGGQYNIWDGTQSNINATLNWWGTTDVQIIRQKIIDNYQYYTLGTVSYIPFLTTPNPYAPTYVTASAGSGGTISPNGLIVLNYGDSQTFNITSSSGYHITNVLVNGTSVGAVSSIMLNNIQPGTTISATFAPDSTPTPSPSPTPVPTSNPTILPTMSPTNNPTSNPTTSPTNHPTATSTS